MLISMRKHGSTGRLQWGFTRAFSSPSWTFPAPSAFLHRRCVPALWSSLWPSFGVTPTALHHPCPRGPRTTQVLCRAGLKEFVYTVWDCPNLSVVVPCAWPCWTSLDSCGPVFKSVQIPADGLPSFCCISCTTHFGVISKLIEGALNLTVPSIPRGIEENWSRNRPLGTLLVTSLHLDIELLTTALWQQPSNQFFIHQIVQPSNPYVYNLGIRICCGTVSKAFHNFR